MSDAVGRASRLASAAERAAAGVGPAASGAVEGGSIDETDREELGSRRTAARGGRSDGERAGAAAAVAAARAEGPSDPGHRPARAAPEPDHPRRRLPVGPAEHLPAPTWTGTSRSCGRRSRSAATATTSTSTRSRSPRSTTACAATRTAACAAPTARSATPACAKGPIDGKRTALRMIFQNGCADPLSRGTVYGGAPLGLRRPTPAVLPGRRQPTLRDRQPGAQPDHRHLRRSGPGHPAHVAERADAGDLQHVHLRRHRRQRRRPRPAARRRVR